MARICDQTSERVRVTLTVLSGMCSEQQATLTCGADLSQTRRLSARRAAVLAGHRSHARL